MQATATTIRIDLENLKPSPNNPRKFFDEAKLAELAESLRSPLGQQLPILVRKVGRDFEILDGERRFRAATIAKLTELECKVVEVDDAQALEITVVANLQREDITPLEEANGVASLLAAGRPVEDIAKDLGKSISWVYLRAKLKDLAPELRKAVDSSSSEFYKWPAVMLELLARFPQAQQKDMLKDWGIKRCTSARELSEVLDREYLHTLKSAPWDLEDAKLLPKAGACSTCPKRSGCQQNLFADAKTDNCLDAACFKAKRQAHTVAVVDQVKKDNPKALLLAENGHHSEIPTKFHKTAQFDYGFKEVKEGTRGSVPAIKVNGAKMGTVVHVIKADAYRSSPGGTDATPAKPATPKERLEQFMKRRTKAFIGKIMAELGGDEDATSPNHWSGGGGAGKCAEGVKRPRRDVLIALAAAFGVEGCQADWKDYNKMVGETDVELDVSLWDQIRDRVISKLVADKEFHCDDTGAVIIADTCDIDHVAIRLQVQNDFPLPKTLAQHFTEDGAPKTGLTKAKPVAPAKKKAKAGA